MDVLFDCPVCAGPNVTRESNRGETGTCAHCTVTIPVPLDARSVRQSGYTRDSIQMALRSGGAPRMLRRLRPVITEFDRPLIASSARVILPPACDSPIAVGF
ncbi:MAG: hypothetical protein ABI680_07230 [Chthoniobacteraceae bacterium]